MSLTVTAPPPPHDPVARGFDRYDATYDGTTYPVYRIGSGPAVIVMHELPSLHAGVVDFALRVRDAGFTVFAPSFVGTPGLPLSPGRNLAGIARACVAREFATWATRKTSPIVGWLRALAADAHRECGGPGVGAVGMCLTGGFALAMMVDDIMLAPVMSQPSVPFGILPHQRRDLGVTDDDLAIIKRRAEGGVCVLGLRFTGDVLVPQARFDRLRAELGDKFVAIEIDSRRGNPHGIPWTAHSVLAHDFVDAPDHPTRHALDRVLDLFRERLVPGAHLKDRSMGS